MNTVAANHSEEPCLPFQPKARYYCTAGYHDLPSKRPPVTIRVALLTWLALFALFGLVFFCGGMQFFSLLTNLGLFR